MIVSSTSKRHTVLANSRQSHCSTTWLDVFMNVIPLCQIANGSHQLVSVIINLL